VICGLLNTSTGLRIQRQACPMRHQPTSIPYFQVKSKAWRQGRIPCPKILAALPTDSLAISTPTATKLKKWVSKLLLLLFLRLHAAQVLVWPQLACHFDRAPTTS
jgi:hypothetical protein